MTASLLLSIALAEDPAMTDAIAEASAERGPDAAAMPAAPVDTAPQDAPAEGATDGPARVERKERDFDMEISFRGRSMSVPDSLLDIWYFDSDDAGWPVPGEDRPKIGAYAVGLEWAYIKNSSGVLVYFDYVGSTMKPGYWDDREEPGDHLDGDYLAPSRNLGLVSLGANYQYEAPFVKTSQTNGKFGLGLTLGGGLGAAFMVGQLERWKPGDDGTPAYVRQATEPADENKQGIPRVLPMVDVNAGLKFNFGDRAVLRLEGGLHTMIYYGGSLGIKF